MKNVHLQCIIFCEILDNKKRYKAEFLTGYVTLRVISTVKNGAKTDELFKIIREEIFKMLFYKVNESVDLYKKYHSFFTEKRSHQKIIILSICSPYDALYFEYFRLSSTHR